MIQPPLPTRQVGRTVDDRHHVGHRVDHARPGRVDRGAPDRREGRRELVAHLAEPLRMRRTRLVARLVALTTGDAPARQQTGRQLAQRRHGLLD